MRDRPNKVILTTIVVLLISLFSGCGAHQKHGATQAHNISLKAGELEKGGIAFITPSTVTGQEEDKQELALTFANVLRADRPDIPLVTLPETLSAINAVDLADDYKKMFEDYRFTGLFPRKTLAKVGQAAGVRYLAQLKLAGMNQGSTNRLGVFGLRLLETKYTHIRLVFQIWDSTNGAIVWECVEELNYAYDTIAEKTVTFKTVVETTAHSLIAQLP